MAAEADEPAAPDPETGEPAAYESRLDELYSDRPDIAALFEEVPEAREVDSAETKLAEPDAPDPEAARSDYSDLHVQEPEPSEISVDAPVPEAAELDSLMTDVSDSLESDLPDAPVPDPNWTEPYPDEVDQGAPELSEPESYDVESATLPEDGIGRETASADQPETDDAPISGPSPAGSEVLDADPAESTWEEPAAPGPEIVDPFPDEPGTQQMDGDEDDEGDEDREDDEQDGGQEIRNDSGRKILRFGPFKKVI